MVHNTTALDASDLLVCSSDLQHKLIKACVLMTSQKTDTACVTEGLRLSTCCCSNDDGLATLSFGTNLQEESSCSLPCIICTPCIVLSPAYAYMARLLQLAETAGIAGVSRRDKDQQKRSQEANLANNMLPNIPELQLRQWLLQILNSTKLNAFPNFIRTSPLGHKNQWHSIQSIYKGSTLMCNSLGLHTNR